MQGWRFCADACEESCALQEECIQPGPKARPNVVKAWETVLLAYGEVDGMGGNPVDLRLCSDLLRDGWQLRGGELMEQVTYCKIAIGEVRQIHADIHDMEKSRRELEANSRHRR